MFLIKTYLPYVIGRFILLVYNMREDEGDDEEEMPSQPALVPVILQQAAEHLRSLCDFGYTQISHSSLL